MPGNLLIAPLIAGFVFFRLCFYSRYRAQSLEGYRLLFEAAVGGFGFLAISRAAIIIIKHLPLGHGLEEWFWREVSSLPYTATACGSVPVAIACAWALNLPLWETWRRAFYDRRVCSLLKIRFRRWFRIWSPAVFFRGLRALLILSPRFWDEVHGQLSMRRRMALNWATGRQNNQLLVLVNHAVRQKYMLAVTLSSRKFYIGYVKTAPSLDPLDTYFRIYPVRSGYRDPITLRFEMTTDYDPVAEKGDPVFVIVPLRDVQVANRFEPITYEAHFQRRQISPAQ